MALHRRRRVVAGRSARLRLVKTTLDPAPGTIRWALEHWIEAVTASNSSPATALHYRHACELYLTFLHATDRVDPHTDPLLTMLTVEHARAWVGWLEATPSRHPKGFMRARGSATVRHYANVLKVFARFCTFDLDVFPIDPLVKFKRPKAHARVIRPYTTDEVERMLDLIAERPEAERNIALVHFLVTTGARAEEACSVNLDRGDLRLDDARVTLFGKGDKERTVKLNETTVALLTAYLRNRDASDCSYLFVNKTGDRLRGDNIYQLVVAWGRKLGISNPTVHRFRHTFATWFLLDHPDQLKQLKDLLGHETLDMVLRYASLVATELAGQARSPGRLPIDPIEEDKPAAHAAPRPLSRRAARELALARRDLGRQQGPNWRDRLR